MLFGLIKRFTSWLFGYSKPLTEEEKKALKEDAEIQSSRFTEINDELSNSIVIVEDKTEVTIINTVRLMLAICFNFPFGYNTYDNNIFKENITKLLDEVLNVDTFWMLLNIQPFVELLWPTGDSDGEFHNVKSDVSPEEYKEHVNKNITKYVNGKLREYITNVFYSNCYRLTTRKRYTTEQYDELIKSCNEFIESMRGCNDVNDFNNRSKTFLESKLEPMEWKRLRARSQKGFTSKPIIYLPSNYPLHDPNYETFTALHYITNIIINTLGTDVANKGGICYSSDFVEELEWKIFKGYVKSDTLRTTHDSKSYTKLSLHDKIETYEIDDGKVTSYVNPTDNITYEFIVSDQSIPSFNLPKLSAYGHEGNNNFVMKMYNILSDSNTYSKYDPRTFPNGSLYNAFDMIIHSDTPIQNVCFDYLVRKNNSWTLAIPINTVETGSPDLNSLEHFVKPVTRIVEHTTN